MPFFIVSKIYDYSFYYRSAKINDSRQIAKKNNNFFPFAFWVVEGVVVLLRHFKARTMKKTAGVFPYYQFEHLRACSGVRHFVSSGARNIGFTADADADGIRENRLLLADAVGYEAERVVMARQVHSDHVAVVGEEDAGRGAFDRDSRLPATDALVTACQGICLAVLSADCVPVLLYDPVKKVIAAIHAGWRGTAARIVCRAVEVMRDRFGCEPADLLAGIAPSIGKCCFEVDEPVADVFRGIFPADSGIVSADSRPGKYRVDLWEANRHELIASGLLPSRIEVAGMCTVCHPDRFFSYRREKERAGRFAAGIMLI